MGYEKAKRYFPHSRIKPYSRGIILVVGAILVLAGGANISCDMWVAEEPQYYQVFEVRGTPWERGYKHGKHFSGKIQSLFTMLLTNSIFPYLNRDRADVAGVMIRYQDEEIYGDGKFARQMMLESAYFLIPYIPEEYMEEMRGIADGSGMAFDDILIMNTFFDTLMGFRSLTFYIKLIQGPELLSVEIIGDMEKDGVDNDGDGEIDENNENLMSPYEPRSYASFVEIPYDAKFRFILDDILDGVNTDSIRIQLNDTIYIAPHPSIKTAPYARDGKTLEVIFTPPDGLTPASSISLLLQCTDLNKTNRERPYHPRSMRDQRITVTTVGYGRPPQKVANKGVPDGRTQPPSIGFAVRGLATKTGAPFMGHNFAMLDSDITHKHATTFIHHTEDGKTYAYVGYTGIVWGFSGMNRHGVSYLINSSDTLNNSFVAGFNEGLIFAKLRPQGVPIGIMGREILSNCDSSKAASKYLEEAPATFGWNFLLADPKGDIIAVEVDGNILKEPEGGYFSYTPNPEDNENLNQWGDPLGSVGEDDLRVSSHFQKNLDEIWYDLITFNIRPQRFWSSFYFRSVKAFWVAGDIINENYGNIDLAKMASILRNVEMEDQRDSMNSVIYEPGKLRMHIAAGQVPASSGSYKMIDLDACLTDGDGSSE